MVINLSIGDVEIRELLMEDVATLMGADMENMGYELARRAAYLNGEPLGPRFDKLKMSEGMKVMKAVTEVNGLNDDGDEGND